MQICPAIHEMVYRRQVHALRHASTRTRETGTQSREKCQDTAPANKKFETTEFVRVLLKIISRLKLAVGTYR